MELCLRRLKGEGARGLNVGAGSTKLHPDIINLDIALGPTTDVCASAECLPFQDGTFDLVLSQEVLEHVRDPFLAMREMKRVLKEGGWVYCQVPFIIGYHPGPADFWRFTREGIRALVEQAGLKCIQVTMGVGPGTGLYRIMVEFVATLMARFATALYIPTKGALAVAFYPLKWLDSILGKSSQADRVAGGYFVVASR